MGANDVNYEIAIKYNLDEKQALKALKDLGDKADHAGKHVEGLSSQFVHLGHTLAAGFAIHEAKKMFIDLNQEVESLKISLSAIMEMNLGGSFKHAQQASEELFKEFQRFSTQTPVTTKEIMEFGTGVSAAVFSAGGNMKDFIKITEMGVVASKVFGANAQYAALELTEMMQGTVNKRMRFAMQMLHAANVSEEKFKKMSGTQRIATIEKVLDSDAMKQATTAYSTSFTGVLSTLEDKMQLTLGKVGLPLFKAITAEIGSWNSWLDRNAATVDSIGQKFGDGLATGFHVIKDAIALLIEHKETLLTIAEMWAAGKGINLAGGLIGSFQKAGTGILGMASSAMNAAQGLTALYFISKAVADEMLESAQRKREREGENTNAADYAQRYNAATGEQDKAQLARMLLNWATEHGGATKAKDGSTIVDKDKMLAALGIDEKTRLLAGMGAGGGGVFHDQVAEAQLALTRAQGVIVSTAMAAAAMHAKDVERNLDGAAQRVLTKAFGWLNDGGLSEFMSDHLGRFDKTPKTPDVNVTIQKVEVVAPDPDRFLVTFETLMRQVTRNPSQAHNTLPGSR